MGTTITFYIVACSCFSHRISGVFAQTFVIYIFDFFTDIIHSIRSSNAQRGVLQYIYLYLLTSARASNRPARHPPPPLNRRVYTPLHRFGDHLACIKTNE
jgi:hypothetical protein